MGPIAKISGKPLSNKFFQTTIKISDIDIDRNYSKPQSFNKTFEFRSS